MQSMFPELVIIGAAFLIILFDLFLGAGKKFFCKYVALAGVFLASVFIFINLSISTEAFGGRFVFDPITSWFKLIFLLAVFLIVIFSEEDALESRGEFYSILLFILSGMMFLASSRDIITMYVSLEMATIPLFVLSAWTKNIRSGEGAIKYLIIGALASAVLLYGLGLLYGLTGQTSFAAISSGLVLSPAMYLAAALITVGIGFKLTLFPFHMWAPDAYEGAPTSVTAFLSVGSKATGLVLAFHLFYRIFGAFLGSWGMLVAMLATFTMTYGNLAAMKQTNIKRFMAYSSISQAGYLIFGFLGTGEQEISSMVFYLFVYVLTNLAVFAVIILHIRETGREDIKSFSGMSKTNPLLALTMMLALFGLAGIPPLAGFVGKLFLFNIAAKHGYHWLVAVAAINSTVSLYYYLGIIRKMYIDPPEATSKILKLKPSFTVGLAIAALGTIICGLIPGFYNSVGLSALQWLTATR